jgi:hypothetical protein
VWDGELREMAISLFHRFHGGELSLLVQQAY